MQQIGARKLTELTLTFTIAGFAAAATTASAQEVVPLGEEFPVNLYTTGSQSNASVSTDRNGNFVIVWESRPIDVGDPGQDGSGSGVIGRLYDGSGEPICDEIRINAQGSGGQSFPRVHVPPSGGNFVVLFNGYNEQDGDRSGVFARTFEGGDGAPVDATDFQVNTYTTGFQLRGALAFIDGNDGVGSNQRANQALDSTPFDNVIVYAGPSADDMDGGISARRSDSAGGGGPNEDEFLINTYTPGEQADPDACAAADGSFVVVWNSEGQDGDMAGMFARRFDANADPLGSEFQVNSYTTGAQAFGRVCCAGDGRFTVAWTDLDGLDGNFSGVFARRFDSSGQPVGAQFQVNSYTPSSQTVNAMACDSSGRTVIVWQTLGHHMTGRAYDSAGQEIGGEFTVSQFDVGVPQQGSAGMAENGGFVVAWHKRSVDGDHNGVQARRFAIVGPGGTTTTTTTSTTSTSTTLPLGICGDPISEDGSAGTASFIKASDALFILRAAIQLEVCQLCVCDVNSSGGIGATDALLVLHEAVGNQVTLECPRC